MHDVRLAFRAIRATPIVSAVAILSLALGIGANTAIFSLVNSLVLQPLPVRDPQRLAILSGGRDARPNQFGPSPAQSYEYAVWEALRDREAPFNGVLAWEAIRFDLAQGGEMQPVEGLFASGDYFTTLGVPALIGRTFRASDDVRGGGGPDGAVAVISYAFWQRQFAGNTNVIGTQLRIERVPFTIIGVTPPEFFGTEVGRTFDVAVPITAEETIRGRDTRLDNPIFFLRIMVRLRPSQSLDQATAALRSLQPAIRDAAMPRGVFAPKVASDFLKIPFTLQIADAGPSSLRQGYERPLLTVFIVVALVLLIACANIANLLLSRATARRHELSVRKALGATSWHLGRQLLIESLVLSVIGAAVGLLFAQWGSRVLVSQLSTDRNQVVLNLPLDWMVLAFTSAITMITAILFGTAPAFRAAVVTPIDALKEHGRDAGSARSRLSSSLIVAQVALSLVLVVAAGLFIRTFARLAQLPLGFDQDRVIVVNVNAARSNVAPERRMALFQDLTRAVAAVPGAAQAGGSVVTPVSGAASLNMVDVPGAAAIPESERILTVHYITPGWLAAYGTPLRSGRDFDDGDGPTGARVVIVNEAFVRKFLSDRNPIGVTVNVRPSGKSKAIVAVVADTVYRSLRDPLGPILYVPFAQAQDDFPIFLSSVSISVRSASGPSSALARSIATALTTIDRDLAFNFRPLADQIGASLVQERVVAMLAGFFGALGLLLAGLGLYGVTAYAVSRRHMEIGIRMALGAEPAKVVWLVLRRVSVLVGLGVVVGSVVSAWASRFVATLLYGVEPSDPVTLVGAAVTLALVGALAGWLPAYRAARINPALALRDE
jgi:predicted permease